MGRKDTQHGGGAQLKLNFPSPGCISKSCLDPDADRHILVCTVNKARTTCCNVSPNSFHVFLRCESLRASSRRTKPQATGRNGSGRQAHRGREGRQSDAPWTYSAAVGLTVRPQPPAGGGRWRWAVATAASSIARGWWLGGGDLVGGSATGGGWRSVGALEWSKLI
jgi:hypothetical protein